MNGRKILIVCLIVIMAGALASCGTVKAKSVGDFSGDWPYPNPKNKRGVSYGFSERNAGDDMDLFGGGIKWFYNWASRPKKVVDREATAHNIAFIPMGWSNVDEDALRAYKRNHPECEYLLAYNEPNLTDQANMTPAQAAKKWPRLLAIAKELDLKVVSPAMNFGTLKGYSHPIKWLDEFFNQKGVSLDDVSAIAIHCYMQDAGAMKWYVGIFKKYGKPIWMTEFCAWEKIANVNQQMVYMSEAIPYLELDPQVERYAWFIPKGGDVANKPYNKLLTNTIPPQLTDLGRIYLNMGPADQDIYVRSGQQIEAEHFTNNNVSTSINKDGFSRPVHFRISTDAAGGILDIYDFTAEKWVEYQVEVPADKTYNLTLRNTASRATAMTIYVDGSAASAISLPQTDTWRTGTFPIHLTAGRHSIRLEVSDGDCALNWLKVE
ncbi:hypothetical protein AGMMS50267_00640 [Spirochaetia bacterium]|nr:hypothetical protein AGMMS50267_00640 [Spirochaetia bacterium]